MASICGPLTGQAFIFQSSAFTGAGFVQPVAVFVTYAIAHFVRRAAAVDDHRAGTGHGHPGRAAFARAVVHLDVVREGAVRADRGVATSRTVGAGAAVLGYTSSAGRSAAKGTQAPG